jgi:hypothetical protein
MGQRTNARAVERLLGEDYTGKSDIHAAVKSAVALVDRLQVRARGVNRSLTVDELELIERWLAAHFYVMSDQVLATETVGGAGGSYQGTTGAGLRASKYGQSAVALDFSGCLQALASNRRAGAAYLGRRPGAQSDYESW